MIFHLFRRTPRDDIITSLYGTIVAQAQDAQALSRGAGWLPGSR